MQNYDALIVGGGPAGSTCAHKLVQAGLRVAVLDREEFPRTKLCAGWVTPEAVADLELDVDAYPHRFSTFEYIIAHIKGFTIKLDTCRSCLLDRSLRRKLLAGRTHAANRVYRW